MNKEQLEKFGNLFFNRGDCYFEQNDVGGWQFKKEPLTLKHIQQHIEGAITLGAPTISHDGFCRYVVWDSDYNFGSLAVLQAVLNKLGFVTYRESVSEKRNREGHLWLFISPAIEAVVAHNFAKVITLAAGLRLDQGSKVAGSIEAFPKGTNTFSNIRVPVGINRKSGERGYWADLSENLEEQLTFKPKFNYKEDIYLHTDLRSRLLELEGPKLHVLPKGGQGILDIIPKWWLEDAYQHGDKFITRCPNCRADQHDKKRKAMHLCIYSDGRFGCIKGCSGRDIWRAFKRMAAA